MNNILSLVLISSFCFFGTKLKVVESSFTEIAPGVVTGYVVTQFDVKIRSTGGKKISIDNVWLKNKNANWKVLNSDSKKVEFINCKSFYFIKGEIKVKAKGGQGKGKPQAEEEKAAFDEDFVIAYRMDNSGSVKYLKVEKIEDLKLVKKK